MSRLAPSIASRITDGFLAGTDQVNTEGLVADEGPTVELSAVGKLLDEAMERFKGRETDADGWLAPRLHAILRLSRRDAAAKGFWLHLAIVDFPAYIRWRHGAISARYTGNDVNQALSRLWWAAELFRMGPDYGPVPGAFSPPDIANTIMRLKAAHNRPFCAAFLEFAAHRRSDGKRLIGRQVNPVSTAINSQLFVAALDAVAPDAGTSLEAGEEWRKEKVTPEDVIDGEPVGPDDLADPDFATKVEAVRGLLDHIADGAGVATAMDPEAGSKRPQPPATVAK